MALALPVFFGPRNPRRHWQSQWHPELCLTETLVCFTRTGYDDVEPINLLAKFW